MLLTLLPTQETVLADTAQSNRSLTHKFIILHTWPYLRGSTEAWETRRHEKLEKKDTFNRLLFFSHPRQCVSLLILLPWATVLRLQHFLDAAQMPVSVLWSYTIWFASVVQKFSREELPWRGEREQLVLTNGCLPWKTAHVCLHASKLPAAKASHREQARRGKQFHRPPSHQEQCKQEPEKKCLAAVNGNCYTVLDKVYCTNLRDQKGKQYPVLWGEHSDVKSDLSSLVVFWLARGTLTKGHRNPLAEKGGKKAGSQKNPSCCLRISQRSPKGITHVQIHIQGRN